MPTVPVLITGLVNVLFVSVSVVALPTSVSVAAGRVRVPEAAAVALTVVVPEDEPARINFPLLKVFAPVTVWISESTMSAAAAAEPSNTPSRNG